MDKPLDKRIPIDPNNVSIVTEDAKCINCGICKITCANQIGVFGNYSLEATGGKAVCINCGQCSIVCPTNAITERFEYQDVKKAIADPDKIVIVSAAPAVRVALGEEFGQEDGSFVQGKMVSLLRKLGFNYVLDTNFAADLTIVEEASELLERINEGKGPLPQFTSCCPSWVKYVEIFHPEMISHLSTTKSPFGMQGATIKTYFAKKKEIDPKKIVNVCLAPCTSKKYEIRREELNSAGKLLGIENLKDNDYVITTRELAQWAREENIDFNALEEEQFDDLMGEASGASVIFGATGGVMEAALRTAYEYATGEKTPEDFLNFEAVRGYEGIKETTVKFGDKEFNVAVIHGTKNAGKVLEQIKSGEKQYHFIEVMTCPGGCVGGGGQPKNKFKNKDVVRKARIASLHNKDMSMAIRKSHENPDIKRIYEEFYKKPLSEMSEKMLHTSFKNRSEILNKGE